MTWLTSLSSEASETEGRGAASALGDCLVSSGLGVVGGEWKRASDADASMDEGQEGDRWCICACACVCVFAWWYGIRLAVERR